MSGLEQSVAEKFRHILEQNQWVTPAPAAAAATAAAATAPIPPAPPAAPMATAPVQAASSYSATPQLVAGGGSHHHLPSSPLMMLMFVLAVIAEAYFIYLVIDSLRNKSDTRDRR